MDSNQTITVWKSDFKDFPFLYEATEWCMGAAIQNAKNFVVIQGYNPYELRKESRFTNMVITYDRCVAMARENGWEDKVVDLLHSFTLTLKQVFDIMSGKLNYPKSHVKRQWR